jgi:hypothetical protein
VGALGVLLSQGSAPITPSNAGRSITSRFKPTRGQIVGQSPASFLVGCVSNFAQTAFANERKFHG